jgi:hypothetical protein
MLTQEQLKEKLIYFPKEGYFIRLPLGNVAGYYENGYIKLKINSKGYFAHRLAWLYMTGEMPKDCIDHINGIKDDNRFENLREATKSQNNLNVGIKKNNKSGYKGVSAYKNKWKATGYLNKKSIHLGYFKYPKDAHNAYVKFILDNHKDFAKAA